MKWATVDNPRLPSVYRGFCPDCGEAWVEVHYNLYDACVGVPTEEQEFEFIFLCAACRYFIRLDTQSFEQYVLEIFPDGTVTIGAGSADEALAISCDACLITEHFDKHEEEVDLLELLSIKGLSGIEDDYLMEERTKPAGFERTTNPIPGKIILEEENF
jgi:hypothetical protein